MGQHPETAEREERQRGRLRYLKQLHFEQTGIKLRRGFGEGIEPDAEGIERQRVGRGVRKGNIEAPVPADVAAGHARLEVQSAEVVQHGRKAEGVSVPSTYPVTPEVSSSSRNDQPAALARKVVGVGLRSINWKGLLLARTVLKFRNIE